MATRLVRASVPDLVFADLREAILADRLAPGERLPAQRTLAAEFGVNITSVREALKRLEQLRLVEVRQGHDTRVRDWRSSGGLEALASLQAVDQDLIGALFEARRLLLVEASRLAAERRTDEQASGLGELAGAFAHAADQQAALLVDWAFMAAVIEASGNLIFQLIMNSVRELYLVSAGPFVRMLGDPTAYRLIADAIQARDAGQAATATAALAEAQERRMLDG